VLEDLAARCRPLLQETGASFVDFSCGRNDFAPLLGSHFVAFDVRRAENTAEFRLQDWFATTRADLPTGPLAIGLNPPFGYQGKLARQFVEHALKFGPCLLFLILPRVQWDLSGYERVYEQDLPEDAFYDPSTQARFKEIYSHFVIYRRIERVCANVGAVRIKTPRGPTVSKPHGVTITRKWEPSRWPFLIVRRVGRNAGQQFYCVVGEGSEHRAYVNKGDVEPGGHWARVHSVDTDYFLKVYLPSHTSLESIVRLAQRMSAHPEPGWNQRQPHAITNGYVWTMVAEWTKL